MLAIKLTVLLVAASLASAGQESNPQATAPAVKAAEIMARVAVNQDRSEALRKQYIYRQHVHVLTHKPGGRLQREETTDYDMIPQPDGVEKKLKLVTGRYWKKGKYESFDGEPVPEADSLDGDLIQSLRDDLTNDKSKDGLGKDLFPLTSDEQKKYDFELLGQEQQDGKNVYHVGFKPKDKSDITWAGEAYVDAAEFQPVRVFTKLSRRMPFMVRTMLGTDVPGIGFNVTYKRQEDGVWFPVSFGTEFRLRAVFFINRNISIALENSNFEHTHVESKMKMVGPAE